MFFNIIFPTLLLLLAIAQRRI